MWSRVRRAGIVSALAFSCSLFAAQPAHAGLGGAPMTPPPGASVSSRVVQPAGSAANSAQGVMRSASGAASSTSASASYTVRETALGNGTVVREYLAADGAVVVHRVARPANAGSERSARQLFPAIRDRRRGRARGARRWPRYPVSVDQSGLVVRSGGHMGAFSGQAWHARAARRRQRLRHPVMARTTTISIGVNLKDRLRAVLAAALLATLAACGGGGKFQRIRQHPERRFAAGQPDSSSRSPRPRRTPCRSRSGRV